MNGKDDPDLQKDPKDPGNDGQLEDLIMNLYQIIHF